MASRERGVKFRCSAHRAGESSANRRGGRRCVRFQLFLIFFEESAVLTCQNRKRRAALRPGASGIDRFGGGGPTRRAALTADEGGG